MRLARAVLLAGAVWMGAGVGPTPARAAEAVTFPSAEQPVALPPFIVEEATKGRPWRYAEAAGYEILSRCEDATTRRVIEAHDQLHQLLAEILPETLQLRTSIPRTLILYDEELQPASSREVIARLMSSTAPLPDNLGGIRIPVTARRYSFLPNLRLWDRDGLAVFMIARRGEFEPDGLALTQDYVSFLVKSRVPALPPWFVHGFLSLHRDMSYRDVRLTLEPLEWISARHTDAVKAAPETAPPVLPLADFLAGRSPAAEPMADFTPVQRWQAQALLFVRWGLDAASGARRAGFLKFVERSATFGVSEELFRECLSLGYAEAQAEMTAYLPTAVRREAHFRPTRIAKLPPFAARNASDGQIARLKGDWERLEIAYVRAISPHLADKYLEQARRTLKRGYDRGERDPRLLAVLGLCELEGGNDGGAREYLEAAANIGPIRPRANYELARLRLAELRASPDGADRRLTAAQAAHVLRPLFAARENSPPLPEVYELIAEVWASTAPIPTRGHLAVLDEGVGLFPRQTTLLLRAAEVFLQHGYREETANLVEVAGRIASDDAARERITKLQQQLAVK